MAETPKPQTYACPLITPPELEAAPDFEHHTLALGKNSHAACLEVGSGSRRADRLQMKPLHPKASRGRLLSAA